VRQENAVEQFRTFCGPYDPEIAKKLEPKTLRAKYGVDRVLNGVHCTDMAEDGPLEVHFIFDTLLS
jgi:nucleoside-diphosphate kinase